MDLGLVCISVSMKAEGPESCKAGYGVESEENVHPNAKTLHGLFPNICCLFPNDQQQPLMQRKKKGKGKGELASSEPTLI